MDTGRLMGIDYGEKKVGIAVTDTLGITVQPLMVLNQSNKKKDLKILSDLCKELNISEIVLGYPLNMNGTVGDSAREVESFRDKLEKETGLTVHLWDERLSSAHAERLMLESDVSRGKRKKFKDTTAAAIILKSFKDSKINRKLTENNE